MVTEHTDNPQWPRPQSIGQYYLLEKIARGGMAEIYKGIAYDMHGIKRTVVIKKILPHAAANREFIDMLIAEAKIAVMLNHGNIAQIYDLGKSGDDYFIVMEYVEGRSVSQVQRECAARKITIPIPISCYICAEVAAGLDYMHQRLDDEGQPLHIVHRDVSPQNVLMSYGGTVKIIDFGIAKARTKLETTEVGILKGKFAYMSPEHARGEVIDHRSDIFSLGVILFEMLTGKRLFKDKDNRQTLRNVRNAKVPKPSSISPAVSEELEAIVCKALAKHSGDRYYRATQMREALLKVVRRDFPDFREQQLAEYIGDLFDHQQSDNTIDEEGKTPFLIVDHTQSAIAAAIAQRGHAADADMVPSMMAQYMIADDDIEASPDADVDQAVGDGDDEQVDYTGRIARRESVHERIVAAFRPVRWKHVVAACGVGVVAILMWAWQQDAWSPKALWQHLRPVPMHGRVLPHPPQPTYVTFAIRSSPSGAKVFLDDQETGLTTPATLVTLLPEREYVFGLHLDGHKYWSQRVSFAPHAKEEIKVPLVIDYGRLAVTTVPAGAVVMLNGQAIGTTPLTYDQIVPGQVIEVNISRRGYASIHLTDRVRAGKTLDIRKALVRIRKR